MGVKLKHASGNGTKLGAPAANPSADITLKVPSTTGSAGQVLAVASANHSSTNAELEWIGEGKILQVQNTTTDTTGSVSLSTGNQYYDITNLNVAITPAASTSKILMTFHAFGESSTNEHLTSFQVKRAISGGATTYLTATAAGSPPAGRSARCCDRSPRSIDRPCRGEGVSPRRSASGFRNA